ncbi:hypothetical protein [Vibrio coralliilyticus]|uniref:hypothetical protein n=1 Tax=Vibrio coralliilyticus TaxID=190893 RepID=UPI001E466568|nr:hypothetical protein [Vibrio coralliilyticus]MCC2525768.1 hypothetical protein [Vibrio coralliilyticus]
MDITKYEDNSLLECFYNDCYFILSRADENDYNSGMWLLEVRDETTSVVFDGWIEHSAKVPLEKAFEFACDCASVESQTGLEVLSKL